jgi:hypothetical protein
MAEITTSENVSSFAEKFMQSAKEAAREAQEESRRMGVPNVYSINGKLYYEMPNGEIKLAQDENGKLIGP